MRVYLTVKIGRMKKNGQEKTENGDDERLLACVCAWRGEPWQGEHKENQQQ